MTRSDESFGLINGFNKGLCSRKIGTSYPGLQIAPVTARKKSPKLDLGDRGEDIAYPISTLIECFFRTPFRWYVGTGGRQQQLIVNFT